MLTCRVGETIINCFDGKYDKYKLKQWSDKNKLICPDCGKYYEYCHGEIVPPYFRHKEKSKDCSAIFSEPETLEHIEGKLILYKWLLEKQEIGIIKNLQLEYFIKSTKQRPDIYFEIENDKYVIEFQCTPIASEFLKRRELYKLANINDIWILGLYKYNLDIDNDQISHSTYYKTIEQYNHIYLDVISSNIYINNSLIRKQLPFNLINLNEYYKFSISDFIINVDIKSISLRNALISPFVESDSNKFEELNRKKELEKELGSMLGGVVSHLNDYFTSNIDKYCNFQYRSGHTPYYLKAIDFNNSDTERSIFIKENSIDFCQKYLKSVVVGRGRRGGPIWGKRTSYYQIASKEIYNFESDQLVSIISNFIINSFKKYQRRHSLIERKNRITEFRAILGEFINESIYIINSSNQKVHSDIKFKFLKNFSITEEYMTNEFIKELKFLKRKKVKKYVFMIPKYNSYFNSLGFSSYVKVNDFNNEIIQYFKSFGFVNVKYLENEGEVFG